MMVHVATWSIGLSQDVKRRLFRSKPYHLPIVLLTSSITRQLASRHENAIVEDLTSGEIVLNFEVILLLSAVSSKGSYVLVLTLCNKELNSPVSMSTPSLVVT